MTLPTNLNKHTHVGNGVNKDWPYTFTIFSTDGSEIKLYLTDIATGAVTEITSNYSIDVDSKMVTYPVSGSPLTSAKKITLLRVVSLTQEIALPNGGAYFAQTIEGGLDKQTAMSQQIQEQIGRMIKHAVSVDPDVSLDLPAPVPLNSFRWNATGKKLELTLDPGTVVEAAHIERVAAEVAKTGAELARDNVAATIGAAVADATEQAEGSAVAAGESAVSAAIAEVSSANNATSSALSAASSAAFATAAANSANLATIAAQSGADIAFTTKALMDADLAHPANTRAIVTADIDANKGIYTKTGASGSGDWGDPYIPPVVDGSVTPEKFGGIATNNLYPFQPNATLKANAGADSTSQTPIKNAVKKIELYGANPSKQYSLYLLYRNASNVWAVRISEVAGQVLMGTVCELNVAGYTETSGVQEVSLVTVNNSGITGKAWIDWSVVPSGATYANLRYAEAGLHPDCYISKTVTRDKLEPMIVNNLYPFQPAATLKAITDENSPLLIKNAVKNIELYGADPLKQYSISLIYRNASNVWAVRITEVSGAILIKHVAELNVAGYTESAGVQEVTLTSISNSGITGKIWIDWSAVPSGTTYANMGGDRTGLHPITYYNKHGIADKISISLPPTIPAVVGHEISLYFDNVIKCTNLSNYQIDVVCNMGKQQNERWTDVPTTPGTYAFTINAYRNGTDLVATASTNIVVKAATVGSGVTKKCLFIGDSTTAAGVYTGEIINLGAADGFTLTLLGTRGSGSNKHEGRSSWAASNYVSNAEYSGATNAFWDGSAFNFAWYLAQNSIATPDHVVINLGINDAANNVSPATFISQLQTMITSIKAANSNIKIGLAVPIPPSHDQDAFGASNNSGLARFKQKNTVFALGQAVIDYCIANASNGIYAVPININLDTVHNMSTEQVAVNSRNSTLITRQNNNVHPLNSGYYQIADVFYYWIKTFE